MITHHIVIHCDQSPLPLSCQRTVAIKTEHENDDVLIRLAVRKHDWGVEEINGKQKHYCPYHRPVR